MRISDWSSDVCSSDLPIAAHASRYAARPDAQEPVARAFGLRAGDGRARNGGGDGGDERPHARVSEPVQPVTGGCRSEEHTSELQSLMRISYAVFCLKKKMLKNQTK